MDWASSPQERAEMESISEPETESWDTPTFRDLGEEEEVPVS